MVLHDHIRARIEPARARLLTHPLYGRMRSLADVQVFMRSHAFAVWDFMSLLKRLQRDLTCVTVPWVPVGDAEVRFLINEIVCGEESDVDPTGGRISHFDLYLRAMGAAGAEDRAIREVTTSLAQGADFAVALRQAKPPAAAARFTTATLTLACAGKTHEVAAAFTYGREDLIPEMFLEVVRRLSSDHPGRLDVFRYYLERHIEVDGGHHGEIARRMTALLCGDDPRKAEEAALAATEAIEARLALWDGILADLPG
jgi:glutathione S-transferase